MGIFMLGSLLAGFAKSILALIIFRGVAGAGGGGIVSIVQIVMSDVVSLRDRYVLDCDSRNDNRSFFMVLNDLLFINEGVSIKVSSVASLHLALVLAP